MPDNGIADGYYSSFDEILNDSAPDAVQPVTPIPLHAGKTVRLLNAGKHCSCTVPHIGWRL